MTTDDLDAKTRTYQAAAQDVRSARQRVGNLHDKGIDDYASLLVLGIAEVLLTTRHEVDDGGDDP